jgi:hypothetical protein
MGSPGRDWTISLFQFSIALAFHEMQPTNRRAMLAHIRALLNTQRFAFDSTDCLSADRGPNSIRQRLAEALHIRIVFSFHHYACEWLRA